MRVQGSLGYLVANIVASRVDLEQLRAKLLVNARQNRHHRQWPHIRMLQGKLSVNISHRPDMRATHTAAAKCWPHSSLKLANSSGMRKSISLSGAVIEMPRAVTGPP